MTRLHPEKQRDLIVLQITGQLFFIGLFFLSLFYWKERQAFDTAHYLFEIIDREFFFVAHQRPIGMVSQVLPLIGIWLKLPMMAIAVLYSVGDILWYYLLFLLLAYRFKSRSGITSLLLILSLTVRYSFFCPVTELLQAGALLPVWMSILYRPFRFRTPLLLALATLIIFSHPLLFIPLAFCLAWWMFTSAKQTQFSNNDRRSILLLLWISLVAITGLKLLLLDSYDHGKTFYPVVYNDYGYLQSMSLSNLMELLAVIASHYSILCILFITTLTFLFLRKKWKPGLLLFSGWAAYLLLILATHRFGDISNYSERMLLPLPFMVAISIAGIVKVTRQFIHKLAAYILLVLILLLHVDLLRITSIPYTLRIRQITAVINASRQLGIQKGIVKEELMEQTSFAMTGWSYSMESLWISALDGRDSCVTIAMQRDHINRIREQKNTLDDDHWVIWAENIKPVKDLNQNYFHLKKGPYISLYENSIFTKENVNLTLVESEKTNNYNAALALEITLADKRIFYTHDSSYLQILIPDGPELRLQIPYHLKGRNTIWIEIPYQHLAAESTIKINLWSGSYLSGSLPIRYKDGRFWEEKQ